MKSNCWTCGTDNICICDRAPEPDEVRSSESALSRARRLTQAEVDAGRAAPWVMGDYEQRDRFNTARDRRSAFHVVRPEKASRRKGPPTS